MNPDTTERFTQVLQRARHAMLVGARPWRQRALAAIVAGGLVLVGAPLTAQAQPSNDPAAQEAPFIELGALDSIAGEAKAHFLLRAGRVMEQQAGQGREVCGMIMTTPRDDAWRVRLLTSNQHMGCVALRFNETGFLPSGETIHTHNVRRPLTLEQAQQLPEAEFSHGPGYVVAGGSVFLLEHPLLPVERVGFINYTQAPSVLTQGGYSDTPQISKITQDRLKSQLQARRGAGPAERAPPGSRRN